MDDRLMTPHSWKTAGLISLVVAVLLMIVAMLRAFSDRAVPARLPDPAGTIGIVGWFDATALVRALFETVGAVVQVPEEQIDALSTISGSGPAYVFFLIERLTEAARHLGFEETEARLMVEQTFLGAAELLAASDVGPEELRRRVTSPNGTTERAIAVMEQADLTAVFVVVTGVAGAALGDALLRILPLRSVLARGTLFGMGAHGAGVARAHQIGREEGTIAGLVMVLVGLVNVLAAPLLGMALR